MGLDVSRFVRAEETPNGAYWIVAGTGKNSGQRGKAIAILALKNSPSAYEIVLQMDSGKLESFPPFSLRPSIPERGES